VYRIDDEGREGGGLVTVFCYPTIVVFSHFLRVNNSHSYISSNTLQQYKPFYIKIRTIITKHNNLPNSPSIAQ